MKSPLFLSLPAYGAMALCLAPVPGNAADDRTFEDGPVGFDNALPEKAPWVEGSTVLPAWPGKSADLVELKSSTDGLPYRIYIDTDSLTTGEDRVVRYTVVLVSSSGVRNVTYEGLHCGEKSYRRLAYGLDGEWRMLEKADWKRIAGLGVNRYRKVLYENYFCDTGDRNLEAKELVRKLRYDNATTNDDG